METPAQAAAAMFEGAIAWLRDTYDDRPYFVERDLVYAVQVRLWQQVRERGLDWLIFNDYPMLPGSRRSLSADLVVRAPLVTCWSQRSSSSSPHTAGPTSCRTSSQ